MKSPFNLRNIHSDVLDAQNQLKYPQTMATKCINEKQMSLPVKHRHEMEYHLTGFLHIVREKVKKFSVWEC